MFLGKCVLKTYSKFTGEHLCQSVISINLKIILRYGCFPVNLLHIFRTPFLKNTSGWLLLYIICRERWTQICAVPLANQLRAVTDTFRRLAQQNIRQINFTKVKSFWPLTNSFWWKPKISIGTQPKCPEYNESRA